MSGSKKGKVRDLYATKNGGSDTVSVWLGKPTAMEEDCCECGHKRDSWSGGRGSKLLLEEICEDGFTAAGVVFPPHGGIVKFKLIVIPNA